MHYFHAHDLHQSLRLNEQRKDITHAAREAREAGREIDLLTEHVERLRLGAAALWELLRDHTQLGDEDLLAKIREIDLRDGIEDGRIREPPRGCPSCGRTNGARHRACIYCAQELAPRSTF